jgi:hypothetical protein
MPYFWLDSNVLIEAHRTYYSFDIAPGFWKAIENCAKADKVRSPVNVFNEISGSKDVLAKWVKDLGTDLFVEPEQLEQQMVGTISQQVLGTYQASEAKRFLAGADPWVIAHASVNKGIVVTQETLAPSNSTKVKIPNICGKFKVPWITTYEMLRQLKIKLN